MKVVLPSGAVAESTNKVVIEQWKKAGYKEVGQEGAAEAAPAKKKPRKGE